MFGMAWDCTWGRGRQLVGFNRGRRRGASEEAIRQTLATPLRQIKHSVSRAARVCCVRASWACGI